MLLANQMKATLIKRLATVLLALLLSGVFVELGIWQLHRAQDLAASSKPAPELPTVALTEVLQAGTNLSPLAANRIVTTSGKYVSSYAAPGQRPLLSNGSPSKQPLELDVRLLEDSGKRGILVVRGLAESSVQEIQQSVKIVGRLYPRQNSDVTASSNGVLSRIDPAMVAGLTDLKLFDGYIVVRQESTVNGEPISAERIPTPVQKSSVGGYYWQHISYVVIWWAMALLVWALPLISRIYRRNTSL